MSACFNSLARSLRPEGAGFARATFGGFARAESTVPARFFARFAVAVAPVAGAGTAALPLRSAAAALLSTATAPVDIAGEHRCVNGTPPRPPGCPRGDLDDCDARESLLAAAATTLAISAVARARCCA